MQSRRLRTRAVLSLLATLCGCRCSRLAGEVEDIDFTRCAQVDAPHERKLRTAQLELSIRDRVLSITTRPGLRIAAFSGPVGGSFAQADYGLLAAARAGLVFFLGGLGDDAALAAANLTALATLHVPVLFVAGGADRLPVIEEAFGSVGAEARELLIHASGLREVRIGQDRFAVVAGSPLGRYAVDAQACGFALADLDDIRAAFGDNSGKGQRSWLLSWGAPSGWGVSSAGAHDVGSPELFALAQALQARGGVFAYPETQAGLAMRDDKGERFAAVVPRLGRTGATRAEGGRVASSVMLLTWNAQGLALNP
jgi:hypothetical protein